MQQKIIRPGSYWASADGKEFEVKHVQDNVVWYQNRENVYSCLIEAFQHRFTERTNHDRG